jgi:peroxiredoxin
MKIGSKIPEFNLPAVDGKNYSVNSFNDNKPMLVIFSCNHCPYVQAYEDRIKQLTADYSNLLSVAAINSNDAVKYPEDSFENMKKRSSDKNFNFIYLRDEEQSAARSFDATHTPEIFLFDKEKKLAYRGKIDDNWREPDKVKNNYLRDAIEEVINDKEVSVPETFSIGCTIKWK